VERRRQGDAQQTSVDILNGLPALVVLERFPVPVLAVDDSGEIVFANTAFAEMVGRTVADVSALTFADVFHVEQPNGQSAVSVVHANADMVVDLVHADGSVVRAKMSKSALVRGDDPVALATFQDLTERLWIDEL
jgi:PAS domain S-box-containing protein